MESSIVSTFIHEDILLSIDTDKVQAVSLEDYDVPKAGYSKQTPLELYEDIPIQQAKTTLMQAATVRALHRIRLTFQNGQVRFKFIHVTHNH